MEPLVFTNSGRGIQPMHPLPPEPVYHEIGPLPRALPIKAAFVLTGIETVPENDIPINRLWRNLQKAAEHRLQVHFGQPIWIGSDGRLSRDRELFADLNEVPFEFQVDLRSYLTMMCLAQLPPEPGLVFEEPKTGFVLDPWKLCLTRADDPKWHDHIMWEAGHFIIHSVMIERERGLKPPAA